jgi:hypothetical protein
LQLRGKRARRHARLLLQPLDGAEAGPVLPLKFQIRKLALALVTGPSDFQNRSLVLLLGLAVGADLEADLRHLVVVQLGLCGDGVHHGGEVIALVLGEFGALLGHLVLLDQRRVLLQRNVADAAIQRAT